MVLSAETEWFEQISRNLDEEEQWEILMHSNVLEFLEHFLSRFPALVILDIDLLGKEINRVIKILRSLKKDLKIMLILSSEKVAICSQALSLGVLTYLLKPISPANASNIIKSTLVSHTTNKQEEM